MEILKSRFTYISVFTDAANDGRWLQTVRQLSRGAAWDFRLNCTLARNPVSCSLICIFLTHPAAEQTANHHAAPSHGMWSMKPNWISSCPCRHSRSRLAYARLEQPCIQNEETGCSASLQRSGWRGRIHDYSGKDLLADDPSDGRARPVSLACENDKMVTTLLTHTSTARLRSIWQPVNAGLSASWRGCTTVERWRIRSHSKL